MQTSRTKSRHDCFAQTAPGLEAIAARELKTLGIKVFKETGGVGFRADSKKLYEANLWLRTASRVVVRIGSFRATAFHELERRASRVNWKDFLPTSGTVSVRVTAHKSRLYHSDAIAERILSAISRVAPAGIALKMKSDHTERGEDEAERSDDLPGTGEACQLFIVRFVNDSCEISADSSGELLHRRGYRKEVGKAPLRETLAAAVLLASGWDARSPLLDPMCGSGTIPIEAALIAGDIAPGMHRTFGFRHWPEFDRESWTDLLTKAGERMSVAEDNRVKTAGIAAHQVGAIAGADRDAGAIVSARRNAERAGVLSRVVFEEAALSETLERLPASENWIVTNPPYGVRVGDRRALRNLYASLGNHVRGSNSELGILSPDDETTRHLGLDLRRRFATRNGGIPVTFFLTKVKRQLEISRV